MLLKLNIPRESNTIQRRRIVLAGDIGATKTNLAVFSIEGERADTIKEATFRSQEYKSLAQITDDFLGDFPIPESVCMGVAGPVLKNRAKLTNLSWEIDGNEIASHLGVQSIHLINDLEATAYGLAMLSEKDVAVIYKGDGEAVGNAAVIAPGTGLGEAGLYWDGNYYHPFATEGGHSDFAPRNAFDFELYTFLEKKFGHVSWERLVCGPGIVNIYQFLRDEKKREEPGWLQEKFKNADAAAVISQHVMQSETCHEAMQMFVRYLAYESANLVLKLRATGGLFIGGGIVPRMVPLLDNGVFYSSFCTSGRLNYLLKQVPVKVILNTKAALLGAAYYGATRLITKKETA